MDGAPDPDWYLENVLLRDGPMSEATLRIVGPIEVWRARWRGLARSTDPVMVRAATQGFVLGQADLDSLGISRQRARTHVERERWTSAGPGRFAPLASPDDPRVRLTLTSAAAAHRRDHDVISGRSAAIVHGLPTVRTPSTPELTAARRTGLGHGPANHRYGAVLLEAEIASWYGVPVTTVARTLVDLARHDRFDAIMAVDAALRENTVAISELQSALEFASGWPGVRSARAVLSLGCPLAESPLESATRLRLHDDGFPEAQLQTVIAGYRVDFYWPRHRLVLEADGRGKYTDDELWREKRRENDLRRAGCRIERVIWADVMQRWPATSRWLSQLLS